MELNEYKQIKNRRYSPKEVLAHLVVSAGNITNKNFESLIVALEQEFIKNVANNKILEKISIKSLEKIKNYWSLSIGQAIAYGNIVFYNLMFENKEISEDEITDMFVYVMKLYSPDNAVEFVKTKFNNSSNIESRYVLL